MELPTKLKLTLCQTGETVLSEIHRLDRERAKDQIDGRWWKDLGETKIEPLDEPDSHWEWRAIVSTYQNKPYFQSVAAITPDGEIQAAMVYRVDLKSVLEPDKRAVYVDRLATAPRNRDKLMESPLYRGGGYGLLVYAIAQSYSLGFEGRVNLLPIANLAWYESRGFTQTDEETADGPLYELPKDRSLQILKQRGLLDA